MKRIEWLDSLRGAAMFCVIIGHVHSMSSEMILWVYAFHMPLFFIISGVVFRYEKYRTLVECVRDQARRLLVPYVTMYLFNIPLWYLNKKVLGDSAATALDLLNGFLYSNQNLGTLTNGALWFLPCLFLVSVVFWCFSDLDKRGVISLEASVIACFLAAWYFSSFYRDPACWHWATVPMAVLFFWMGYAFGRARGRFEESFRPAISPLGKERYVLIALLVLSLGTWLAFLNGKISMHANRYNTIAFTLIAAAAISLGLAMLFIKIGKSRIFDFAGRNSIVYLGFHIPILRFIENCPFTSGFAESHAMLTAIAVFLLLIPVTLFINRFCPFVVGRLPVHQV